jgi:hypothetical protein
MIGHHFVQPGRGLRAEAELTVQESAGDPGSVIEVLLTRLNRDPEDDCRDNPERDRHLPAISA